MRGFGFEVISRRGSHMKLQRTTPGGDRETLTVPDHRELDTGTCRAILRQATKYVPLAQLAPLFYSD